MVVIFNQHCSFEVLERLFNVSLVVWFWSGYIFQSLVKNLLLCICKFVVSKVYNVRFVCL